MNIISHFSPLSLLKGADGNIEGGDSDVEDENNAKEIKEQKLAQKAKFDDAYDTKSLDKTEGLYRLHA